MLQKDRKVVQHQPLGREIGAVRIEVDPAAGFRGEIFDQDGPDYAARPDVPTPGPARPLEQAPRGSVRPPLPASGA